MENLIGITYNFLTVINGPIRKNNKIYWECQCKCGNKTIVRSDGLKSGRTKSCGCYKKNILITNNISRQTLDLTNQRFGKLVALDPTVDRTKDGRVIWHCICDCGNDYYASSHDLKENKVQSCGCLKSKGENLIAALLTQNKIPFEQQKTFDTCRFPDTNYLAKFDFWVNNSYLIEYDGEQHFYYKNSLYTWNTELNYKKVKIHDNYKTQWCQENHIPLIRISYTKLKDLTINDLLFI